MTVAGANFGSTQGTSTLTFNGTPASPSSWSATSILASVPSGATTGNIVVTVSGVASNGANFTVLPTPSITSLSPNSGSVGSSITITGTNFGPTQGSSTVTFNGTAASATSWSPTSIVVPVPTGATTGAVNVTVTGITSNAVNFSVPNSAPSITSVSPAIGEIGATVTLVGSYFGATQSGSTVTFSGIAARATNWSDSIITARVPAGLSPGIATVNVVVNQMASNGVQFTVTKPLFVTPNRSTLLVGNTRAIQLLDENGALISNPTWSFDNSSIAEIIPPQNPGAPTLLQADAVGTTTVTAIYGDRTGIATVSVLAAGASFPIGTVQWSLPSLGSYGISSSVQSLRVDNNTPDLYVEDDGAYNGNGAIRALNADGSQKWIWPPSSSGQFPTLIAGDDQGGALYFVSQNSPGPFDSYCYFGRVDQTGTESWQYQESNCDEDYTIAPDGTIFLLEPSFQNTSSTVVTALDPTTGQVKFTIPLPSIYTGLMSSSSDGSVYLPFNTNVDFQLIVMHSDGSYSTQQLDSARAGAMTRAVPDGQGGVVLAAADATSSTGALYHMSTSGTSKFSLPFNPAPPRGDPLTTDDTLLLGEDGTAYMITSSSYRTVGDGLAAVDTNTGAVKWTVASPGVYSNVGAVTSDGSLTFQYRLLNDFSQHQALANSTGQVSPLFANPDGSDGGPVITRLAFPLLPSYWTLGTWHAFQNDGSLAAITGPSSGPGSEIGSSAWPSAGGEPQRQHGGNPTATITVNFSGNKSQGDQLTFSGAGTCGEALGLRYCPNESWTFYIEGVATVSDDASKWKIRQNAVITRAGNTKDAQGVLHAVSDSFNSNRIPGDDDPCVLNDSRPGCAGIVSVQQPSGQKTIYWLDHPGSLYQASADAVWDSITLNGLFTSKACNRFGICATVKWFIKLQVDSGSILNCAQSLDGLLGQPKTCP